MKNNYNYIIIFLIVFENCFKFRYFTKKLEHKPISNELIQNKYQENMINQNDNKYINRSKITLVHDKRWISAAHPWNIPDPKTYVSPIIVHLNKINNSEKEIHYYTQNQFGNDMKQVNMNMVYPSPYINNYNFPPPYYRRLKEKIKK